MSGTNVQFLAHSLSKDSSRVDKLIDHLQSVAARAAEYAAAFGAKEEAYLAGLLHDFGKYGELFQQRLQGEAEHIDHWSAGAWLALQKYKAKGLAVALAVQGHHIGLQQASKDSFRSLSPDQLSQHHPLNLRLSSPADNATAELQLPDAASLPDSIYNHQDLHAAAAMLDVRMLFSSLVDADFLETEAHFNARNGQKQYRLPAPDLNPSAALDILVAHVREMAEKTEASEAMKEIRARLFSDCLAAGEKPPGLFTLTAPTGSGKTLAMMAFALKHALTHGLRRIVYVIPYLSIIEQTVHVYRQVFENAMGPDYVLEHHSLAGTSGQDDGQGGNRESSRLATENWDAPIVITTSVQFLESLFSNRPSACRKLHRLAQSVILFDEVQTLPVELAIPTLATLSRLVERYRSTVVFATATQPAFTHLHESVKKWCVAGWQPTEIVQDKPKLFSRAKRTEVTWPKLDERLPWGELADRLKECPRVLCVVNLKRHALELYRLLRDKLGEDKNLFHLSTNMCPAHRKDVLGAIRNLLDDSNGPPCRLISTQCVEAGVDVDFPVVYRALGPLDSIAQAAGRCNRHDTLPQPGRVVVFIPEDEKYPAGGYETATSVARVLLTRESDIDDPKLFQKYYCRLYNITRPEERRADLSDAITNRDFVETSRQYKLIDRSAVNLLVPYVPEVFLSLLEEVRGGYGLTSHWVRKARPYAVSIYRPDMGAPFIRLSSPDRPKAPDDWYAVAWNRNEEVSDYYHPKEGLIHKTTEKHWIA